MSAYKTILSDHVDQGVLPRPYADDLPTGPPCQPLVATDRADAIHFLRDDLGGRFVLVGQNKVPIWKGWPTRWPTAETVLQHEAQGGKLGLIPDSLGMVAVDIDAGDPARLVAAYGEPLIGLKTKRGFHLFYDSDQTIGDRNGLELLGVEFDVKGAGYVREHDGGFFDLADARNSRLPGQTFPLAQAFLISKVELDRTAPRTPESGPQPTPAIRPELAFVGNRNASLFDHLAHWVRGQNPGKHRGKWKARVLAEAKRYNALIPQPMLDWEVEQTAASAAKRQWKFWKPSTPDNFNWDSELQAAKGIASGVARRAKEQYRDRRIEELDAQGWTQRAIAQEFGISRGAVQHVLRRGY